MTRLQQSRTRGQLEAAIAEETTAWEKDILGRGPAQVRAILVEDLVVVRLNEALTLKEQHLARTSRGRQLVREARDELINMYARELTDTIEDLLPVPVVGFHSDICTDSNERIIVITLERPVDID